MTKYTIIIFMIVVNIIFSQTAEEISKATGGFGIPGFKWPL